MAEARPASHEPQVQYLEYGTSEKGNKTKILKSVYRDFIACAHRTKNQFYNGLWPTTWDNFLAAYVIFFLVVAVDHPFMNYFSQYIWMLGVSLRIDELQSYYFKILLLSFVSSLVYFVCALYLRQYLIRMLLSYKCWLYTPPNSVNYLVMVWALIIRIISGRRPSLLSYQRSLPRMSVPPVRTTVRKLLESVKPVLDKEEYQKMELEAKEFLSTFGSKLNWVLYLKSWWAPNYHTDWWEKYVYLMGREPLSVNSNYYICSQISWIPTTRQTSRAAGITSLIIAFKDLLDSEELEPLVIRNTIPLCMNQYQRMFSTARIPRTDGDILRSHSGARHIAVYARGHYYKVYIDDANGLRLNCLDWESVFDWILKDAESWSSSEAELRLASLTASDRTTWAECRREHFTSGINRDSVHAIEESIFVVVLDDHEFTDLSERGKYLLHGDGKSFWFDKTFNCIFFTDGRMGINCEHTWADAPVAGHMVEYFITNEFLYRIYSESGHCKPYLLPHDMNASTVSSKAVITPMRLYWDMNSDLERIINESYVFACKNNDDLNLEIRIHDVFGKGFIKKTKNSPDAFIQMALQLAYYRDSEGSFAHTYEASMTRLYLHGRTETVRSMTCEVQQVVYAMNDPDVPAKEKCRLIRVAAQKHQKLYRDSMSGKGIDRHLFALYIVCKGQGYNSPFLKNTLTMPWTLSTSQTPMTQSNRVYDLNRGDIQSSFSPGGGFGPVSDKGYGVAYVIMNDTLTCFHVSSKRSCGATDSKRYMDNVFWALSEMKRVFNEAGVN